MPAGVRISMVVALALAGCSASHGRVPGIDANAPLVSLSHAQWMTLCEWRESARPDGAPRRYLCDETTDTIRTDIAEEDCTTACYDWSSSLCASLGLGGEYRTFVGRSEESCPATVEEYAACWESLADNACYRPGETPACEHFWGRCSLTLPDAGPEGDR